METLKEQFARAENSTDRNRIAQDDSRLRFHLMPPVGWLNDPNGLYEKDGIYHIFYQYAPQNAQGTGKKGWGHYTTKDFIHYQEQEPALYPDQFMDEGGAYSGSAFVDDSGLVHFFYTGNGKDKGDYDYINEGRRHWVNHFTTTDGASFSPKETLLKNSDYPKYLSCHVRDPKIIAQPNGYDMVLGARTRDSKGHIQVFHSDDLKTWKPQSVIRPVKEFGYMWECPDVFRLDGKMILITCPQGVDQNGYLYENIYQNGCFLLEDRLDQDQTVDGFQELDNGFDFYAPQSFLDEKSRRILIGWMGIPDADYTNPTAEKGWQHALTLPRVLHFKNNRLYQMPIEEMDRLIETTKTILLKKDESYPLDSPVFKLDLAIKNKPFSLDLRHDAKIFWKDGLFTLSLGESGFGRDARHIELDHLETISIWSDTSSLEIFLNEGERALTTRIYDQKQPLSLKSDRDLEAKFSSLSSFEIAWR